LLLSFQVNTAVQRSWLYYKDPMLSYKDGEATAAPRPFNVASLPGLGDAARCYRESVEKKLTNARNLCGLFHQVNAFVALFWLQHQFQAAV
jgi:hypothetical protein